MNLLVSEKLEELKLICESHSVSSLFLFGSALTNEFNSESDLDFAVLFNDDLSPLEHGDAYFGLLDGLELLFDRKIDLISYRVVKNPIFKAKLDSTKVVLYAAA